MINIWYYDFRKFIHFIHPRTSGKRKKNRKNCQDKNPELGTRDKSIQLKITANSTLFGSFPCLWLLFTGEIICKAALLFLLPFYTDINEDSILKFTSQHINWELYWDLDFLFPSNIFFLVKFFSSYLPNEYKLLRHHANLNKSCHI